jgi:GTP pyrophosphokinase
MNQRHLQNTGETDEAYTLEERFAQVVNGMVQNHPGMDPTRIRRAFQYLQDCLTKEPEEARSRDSLVALEQAEILGRLNADEETLIAALLHDLLSRECSTEEEIVAQFGEEVFGLIQGVSRTGKMKYRSRMEEQAENFRMMILAMARDLRVVLLNLVNRLQVMRTVHELDEEKQQEIAQETLEIYAPLANRLGIARLKWELEDLCMRVLHPAMYRDLEQRVPQNRKERQAYIDEIIDILKKELADHAITGRVVGRPKHFYSIYQKIVKRGVSFEDIFDLIALRVITDTPAHCYAILGIIHSRWRPVPGRFKDYIGVAKSNMYQSLHTAVIGPKGQKVELQIRTEEMHRIAEQGIAAHWTYKEGKRIAPSMQQKFAWLRQLLEWQKEVKSPREFMESVKTDLFEESVYVFTPDGEVKELPAGSTPLDFAYSIHSDVGNRCTGAKINNRMVSLKAKLKTGDTVHILTSKNQTPNKDWLKLVRSTKAKNRIRHFLKQEEETRSLSLGQEILEKEARKHGLSLSKLLKSDEMRLTVEELGFRKTEKIIAAVGFGHVSARQVLGRFIPHEETGETPAPARPRKPSKKAKDGIRIRGVEDILVRFSRCCNPLPGDEIIGLITRGRGVSIHTVDCTNMRHGAYEPDRLIDADWDVTEERIRPVVISVITTNKPGILASISEKISAEDINIRSADVRTREKDDKSICRFELEIKSKRDLDRILRAIAKINEVIEVKRVMGF